MFDSVDCVVVGAGVVGLATARALALRGREVLVLEAENAIGTGIRSRNSEVIHEASNTPQARSRHVCVCKASACSMPIVLSAVCHTSAAAS